ncbi:MAG: hypothetical protein JXA39_08865 [Bacteroidales bacterium]|nr:hypothetical protein [Bacteroidales bacterium]
MDFSKITRIVLYVVAGISLLVILFFYAGPKTVDMDELDMRVEELMAPADLDMAAPLPVADSAETDSLNVEETTPAEAEQDDEIFSTAKAVDTSDINLRDNMSLWEYMVYNRTDIALIWAYILFIITALAAIIFPLIGVFSSGKAIIRLLGLLAAAAVLILVSYFMSSPEPIDIIGYAGESNRNPATLRMIDTTLFVTYMLFGLAVLSILYSMISRVFK